MHRNIKICLGFIGLFSTIGFSASHNPQEFLKKISGSADEGAQIVHHYCESCHAVKPLIPLGAPKMLHKADWDARVKKGMTELFKNTSEGFNLMPARGGCFECSDEQLLLAIFSLLPESLKKSH